MLETFAGFEISAIKKKNQAMAGSVAINIKKNVANKVFKNGQFKIWSTAIFNYSTAHGGGRVVSASGSETSVSSSTPASAIIYDAYTSIVKIKK